MEVVGMKAPVKLHLFFFYLRLFSIIQCQCPLHCDTPHCHWTFIAKLWQLIRAVPRYTSDPGNSDSVWLLGNVPVIHCAALLPSKILYPCSITKGMFVMPMSPPFVVAHGSNHHGKDGIKSSEEERFKYHRVQFMETAVARQNRSDWEVCEGCAPKAVSQTAAVSMEGCNHRYCKSCFKTLCLPKWVLGLQNTKEIMSLIRL